MKFNFANGLTVFRREMAAYFNAAIAYIFIIVFVLLNGVLFMTQFFLVGRADMRPFFATLPFILVVFLPAVTMRLWAEERKGNTLELLLTFPMRTEELVLGKFMASFVFYLAALAGTLPIPVMLRILGHPDLGAVLSAYVGAAMLGAFFLAVGIFISGLCRDQIVAFILAMMACFGLYLIGTEFLATSIDGWIPGLGSFLSHFIGAARHFDSFQRGVIDNRDLLYFLIGTLLFLVLNGFWLEGRFRPKAKAIFTSACLIAAGIFLMSNWLCASLPLGRFDLTEGKIYTMAPATQKILRQLKAPVAIKFYVSPVEKMPTGMKTLEQDVVDKLDELRIASKGNLQYKIFHMEAANVVEGGNRAEKKESLEEQISRKGIEPFQVQSIESDEVGVRLVYAALSIAYKEKPEETIPRLMPDNLNELEYSLISKIFRLALPEVPKVAMVAPYEEKAVDPRMMAIFAQLGAKMGGMGREDNYELAFSALEYEGYEIARIKLTEAEPIPAGTKTLILLEPVQLTERQCYEVSRFLHAGGSVFIAVQNIDYHYEPAGRTVEIRAVEKKPEINPLLLGWGLEVDENILADKQNETISLGGAARLGPFQISVPVKLPIQILIPSSQMNQDLSITSRLSTLFYLWGSALKTDEQKLKAENLKLQILFSSSPDSWTVPFQGGFLTAQSFRMNAASKHGPFPLAVMVQGQFPDAFEGKPVPAWSVPPTEEEGQESTKKPSAPKDEEPMTINPKPGKLVLTGAATMFQKNLIGSGGHLNFLMNAVDILTLGDELVTVRSKQPIDRSIGRISTAGKIGWRIFVVLLVPFLLAVTGAFRGILRRRAKQNYLQNLKRAA